MPMPINICLSRLRLGLASGAAGTAAGLTTFPVADVLSAPFDAPVRVVLDTLTVRARPFAPCLLRVDFATPVSSLGGGLTAPPDREDAVPPCFY
jgi:hypothetical protein